MTKAMLIAKAASVDVGGWLHDLNPFIVNFGGGLGIRWYGVSYLLGFLVGYLLLRTLSKRGLIAIPADRVVDVILMLAVGAIVGGRVGYCVLYRPSYLWTFTGDLPFWQVLALNKGGMASHGGMVGVIIACVLIARGFKNEAGERVGSCARLHVMDAVSLAAPFGLMFGRLANFINGELLGRIVRQPADGPGAPWWSVRYPQELLGDHAQGVVRTPEQAGALTRLAAELTPQGEQIEAGLARIVDQIQRGDSVVQQAIKPLVSARHPSQLYQGITEGLVVAVVVWWIARKPRLPGVVTAWFLISYGLLRVLTEFYRLPDSHFDTEAGLFDLTGPRPLGLSRGQWFSAVMVVVGIAMLVWRAHRAEDRRNLGWAGRGQSAG